MSPRRPSPAAAGKSRRPAVAARAKAEAAAEEPKEAAALREPPPPAELQPHELAAHVDPAEFKFETTADLPPIEPSFGQSRALAALEFGLDIRAKGFNLYLKGPRGTGKTSILLDLLRKRAAGETRPPDRLYVYDFDDPDRPRALTVPAGTGPKLRQDMADLVDRLKREIPRLRETEAYHARRTEVEKGFRVKEGELFNRLRRAARRRSLELDIGQGELTIQALRDGKVMSAEAIEALPLKEREAIEHEVRRFQERVNEFLRDQRVLTRRRDEAMTALDEDQIVGLLHEHMKGLRERWSSLPDVAAYLDRVEGHVPRVFRRWVEDEATELETLIDPRRGSRDDALVPFLVNVLVSNKDTKGAPVIVENNPTFGNLVGVVEYKEQFGVLSTDLTMIKPGALHRADGGYLVLQAVDVLTNPFAYDALKRALRNGEVRIAEPDAEPRGRALVAPRPEPVPIDVKVILIGDDEVYYKLLAYDDDFARLFKVQADFDADVPITKGAVQRFARFVSRVCREGGLPHADRAGTARLAEAAMRMADRRDRISVKLAELSDLIEESAYRAKRAGEAAIGPVHVDLALRERHFRRSRAVDELLEDVKEGEILLRTRGEAVGEINGVALYDVGDYQFGIPSRITARTWTGSAGIAHIDRDVDLSGPIHNKAVLIIQGILGSLFGRDRSMTLSASVTFEQMYGGVEGDSATCAELYVLLSSIADAPLRQGVAVTGSLNQAGEVQPVGGINEKIEGMFDVCRLQGLTGTQGVVIPRANARHLCLRADVVEAVREGKFHVWPVRRLEDPVGLLFGLPAGRRDKRSRSGFTRGSLFDLVAQRLRTFAGNLKRDADPPEDED